MLVLPKKSGSLRRSTWLEAQKPRKPDLEPPGKRRNKVCARLSANIGRLEPTGEKRLRHTLNTLQLQTCMLGPLTK
jgi:hypothetical protein